MENKTELFVEKAKLIHGDKYDYSKVIYTKTKSKITIICPIHGEFEQRASSHVGTQKQGCKKCANDSYKKGLNWFLNEAELTHNDRYDYSLIKDVYMNKPVNIICKKHGMFAQTPYKHINRKQGCHICAETKKTTDDFIKSSIIKHGDIYDYSLVKYINNKTKVKIICKTHGVFEQTAGSHMSGVGCTYCKESKGERTVRLLLNNHKIEFKQQHTFPECKNITLLSFDFYLPNFNTCIEFNGRQHYEPIECFGGDRQLEKQLNNDKIKMEYCLNNNIPLIVIKYDENIKEKLSNILSI